MVRYNPELELLSFCSISFLDYGYIHKMAAIAENMPWSCQETLVLRWIFGRRASEINNYLSGSNTADHGKLSVFGETVISQWSREGLPATSQLDGNWRVVHQRCGRQRMHWKLKGVVWTTTRAVLALRYLWWRLRELHFWEMQSRVVSRTGGQPPT